MKPNNPISVLMVDDEPLVLSGYKRTLGRAFELTIAEGAAAGLTAIDAAKEPYAVIVTDMRMPNMNGIQFINAARAKSHDTVFMMLSGNADQQTAVDAVNQGQIFRFLNKPCPAEQLEPAIKAAARQYELITAERILLRDTFTGSIKFMTDALELANPRLCAFQSQVKQIVQRACGAIGVKCDWQLYVAGSLCLVGLMTMPIPPSISTISDEKFAQAAEIAGHLLSHIPRLGPIAAMIRKQRDNVPPLPDNLTTLTPENFEILGVRLLRFSVDLAREMQKSGTMLAAAGRLSQSRRYDPKLVNGFIASLQGTASDPSSVVEINVTAVQQSMVLADDVKKTDGELLFARGYLLSDLAITTLRNMAASGAIKPTVFVRKSAPASTVTSAPKEAA